MGRNPCSQRLCDGCCLSVGASVGLALAVLLPLLLPWPSLLGVELRGRSFRATTVFRALRGAFIWSYPVLRILWPGCRILAHARAIGGLSASATDCSSGLVVLMDACGCAVQMALNLWWGWQILSKVCT